MFLRSFQEDDYPSVLLAIFIEHPTPFIKEFFQHLILLKYPKVKVDLYIHYAVSNGISHLETLNLKCQLIIRMLRETHIVYFVG